MKLKSKIPLFAIAISFVLVCALSYRVWWVNAHALTIPEEIYQMGEWVPLDGNFHYSSSENTNGYSMRITEISLTTYDGYLEKHGITPQHPNAHSNQTSVIDVTIELKNDREETEPVGGIDFLGTVLIPQANNTYYICDLGNENSLWPLAQPNITTSKIAIKPHTSYVLHVPYVVNLTGEEIYRTPITDTTFDLLVSRLPVEKRIRVSL